MDSKETRPDRENERGVFDDSASAGSEGKDRRQSSAQAGARGAKGQVQKSAKKGPSKTLVMGSLPNRPAPTTPGKKLTFVGLGDEMLPPRRRSLPGKVEGFRPVGAEEPPPLPSQAVNVDIDVSDMEEDEPATVKMSGDLAALARTVMNAPLDEPEELGRAKVAAPGLETQLLGATRTRDAVSWLRSMPRRPRSVLFVAASLFGAAVLAVLATMALLQREDEPVGDARSGKPVAASSEPAQVKGAVAAASAPPSSAEAETRSEEPDLQAASLGSPRSSDRNTVTITLTGVHGNTTTYVNGAPVELPITVPRSKKAVKVEVVSSDSRYAVKRVVPSKDKTVYMRMKRDTAKKGALLKKTTSM